MIISRLYCCISLLLLFFQARFLLYCSGAYSLISQISLRWKIKRTSYCFTKHSVMNYETHSHKVVFFYRMQSMGRTTAMYLSTHTMQKSNGFKTSAIEFTSVSTVCTEELCHRQRWTKVVGKFRQMISWAMARWNGKKSAGRIPSTFDLIIMETDKE